MLASASRFDQAHLHDGQLLMTLGQLSHQLLVVVLYSIFGSGVTALTTPRCLLLCRHPPPVAVLSLSCQLRLERRHPLLQLRRRVLGSSLSVLRPYCCVVVQRRRLLQSAGAGAQPGLWRQNSWMTWSSRKRRGSRTQCHC